MASAPAPETDKPKKSHLTTYIIAAIVGAFLLVAVLPLLKETTVPPILQALHLGGEIFLRLLKMMVVPLVMASVMSGILGLGDVRKLGRPGGYAVLYYLSTTVLAVIVGLAVVNIIKPGVGALNAEQQEKLKQGGAANTVKVLNYLAKETDVEKEDLVEIFEPLESGLQAQDPSISTMIEGLVLMLFTENLFANAVETNLLPLIVFSIIFAAMLSTMGERVKSITLMIGQINDALMSFIMLLMKTAPLGIFCLVGSRFGKAVMDDELEEVLQQTGWYVVTVICGLAIHALITLPAIYWIFTRKNPYRFIYHMSQALLTAFSTASSSATLPITMECANRKAGVSKRSTNFVLPLGATVNMDGTALYEAAAALFIAQVIGMELTLMQQLVVAVTATLAAIGAAGIPEAGLITMLIVLNAIPLPVEYVALILPVDWLLDRFRTSVNAFGDSVGAAVVDQSFDKASP